MYFNVIITHQKLPKNTLIQVQRYLALTWLQNKEQKQENIVSRSSNQWNNYRKKFHNKYKAISNFNLRKQVHAMDRLVQQIYKHNPMQMSE